jgi:hypothetical protein
MISPIELMNSFQNSADDINNFHSGEYEWFRELDTSDLEYIADLIKEDITEVD